MMGILVVVVAFALLDGFQAIPLNESYDCLTGDECEKINATTRSVLNNKLYCCRAGAGGIKINSTTFSFYSYGGNTSNLNSVQSVDNTDVSKQEGPKDGKIQQNYSSNVTCKCGAVDRKKLDEEMSKMWQRVQAIISKFSWPF